MKNLQTLGKILLLVTAAGYLIFTLVCFTGRDDKAVCSGLCITLASSDEGVSPIDTAYIRELMVHHKFFPEGQQLDAVPLSVIDSTLTANPYIKCALVYFDSANRLCLDITPHTPVMHIIPEGEDPYYIGTEGESMPTDIYTADLPLASGHITRQFAATRLSVLARIMAEDSFWDDQIGQIYVSRDSTITIMPRVGDFNIRLGHARNIRQKLAHLKAFYTDALPQVGWNIYDEVNLEYENQIIATRKRIK